MMYKNRKKINIGSGSGVHVKNIESLNNVFIRDFTIVYCRYEKFHGTLLSPGIMSDSFFISDEILSKEELNKITEEDCFEILFRHISKELFLNLMQKVANENFCKGKESVQSEMRKVLGIYDSY